MKLFAYGIEEHTPVLIREKTNGRKLLYQMKIVQIKDLNDGKEHEFYDGYKWYSSKVSEVPKIFEENLEYGINVDIKYNIIGYNNDSKIRIESGLISLLTHTAFDENCIGYGYVYYLDPCYKNFDGMYLPDNRFALNFSSTMYQPVITGINKGTGEKFYNIENSKVIANGYLVDFKL